MHTQHITHIYTLNNNKEKAYKHTNTNKTRERIAYICLDLCREKKAKIMLKTIK